jgi:acyl-CoA synthetase (AMP-forming)/AMP-acid ligase II
VELGVTTETDRLGAGTAQQAVTEHILGLADRSGYAAVLIDGVEGTVTTWLQFARTVRAAARGLSRRGLQRGDTVGVFVHDAASHAVAVHAVRAAGGVAAPIRAPAVPVRAPAAPAVPASWAAEDIAVQLKECRARLLITSAPLAEVAIQAAERSLVRQVFAFGEAAETTPFASLLDVAKHAQSGVAGPNGSIGTPLGYIPGQMPDFSRPRLSEEHGLGLTGRDLGLTRRDVVVAAPPCGEGNAYTAQLDMALAAGATIVAAPLARVTDAVQAYKGTAAIVPGGTHVPGVPPGRVFTVG